MYVRGVRPALSVAFSRSVGYSEKRPLQSLVTLEHFPPTALRCVYIAARHRQIYCFINVMYRSSTRFLHEEKRPAILKRSYNLFWNLYGSWRKSNNGKTARLFFLPHKCPGKERNYELRKRLDCFFFFFSCVL